MITSRLRRASAAGIVALMILAASGSLSRVWAGEGIFVPPPKGADDTLDKGENPDDEGGVDVVKTLQSDLLTGKVLGIGTDGMLRLGGQQFCGEVAVLLRSLESVDLYWTLGESALDKVVLTNADHLLGEVTGVSAKAVVIESEVAGIVRIPRKMVTSISFALGEGVLVGSNFTNGRMKPWKVRGGKWSLADGKLICTSTGTTDAIHAELDLRKAATFVARVKSDRGLRCGMVLFADTTHGQYGRNSVYAAIYNNEYHVGYSLNGRNTTAARRSAGRTLKEATLRFAYDPATSKSRVWCDSTDLGEIDVPEKRERGRYVMFVCDYPSQVMYLQVLQGIVPPYEDLGAGEEEADLIEFTTKDQVSATDLTLADGKLIVKTALGELRPPVERLSQIVFRKKGRQTIPRAEGDVRVYTTGSRLTLQLKELTDKHLLGTSSSWGEVKLRRAAIKRIEFKLGK